MLEGEKKEEEMISLRALKSCLKFRSGCCFSFYASAISIIQFVISFVGEISFLEREREKEKTKIEKTKKNRSFYVKRKFVADDTAVVRLKNQGSTPSFFHLHIFSELNF